jgi:hypothetical protein
MNDTDVQQILLNIIQKAQEGQSLQFRFIMSWREFQHYQGVARSTKIIIRMLEDSNNRLFKEYCQDIIVGISDFNKLLAYNQLEDIIAFYEAELETLTRMLDDYDEYLSQGHFWYSFLGGERSLWRSH